MLELNNALFLWLNAPENPPAALQTLALICAKYLILLLPLLLTLGWLRGTPRTRQAMLAAATAAGLGLAVSGLIGHWWPHPRPFVVGLGRTLLEHAATPSFPSNHLTLWWGVTITLALHPVARLWGTALVLLGLAIAWGRIYLGVHYPLDMAGALVLASLLAFLLRYPLSSLVLRAYEIAMPLYSKLFAPFIAWGWVRH